MDKMSEFGFIGPCLHLRYDAIRINVIQITVGDVGSRMANKYPQFFLLATIC